MQLGSYHLIFIFIQKYFWLFFCVPFVLKQWHILYILLWPISLLMTVQTNFLRTSCCIKHWCWYCKWLCLQTNEKTCMEDEIFNRVFHFSLVKLKELSSGSSSSRRTLVSFSASSCKGWKNTFVHYNHGGINLNRIKHGCNIVWR